MSEGTLALKRRVYQLTAEFSSAFTAAAVALQTPPVNARTLELVRACRALGEVYEGALDRLLAALHEEGDAGEAARAENLKTQLHRELSLLLSHPATRQLQF